MQRLRSAVTILRSTHPTIESIPEKEAHHPTPPLIKPLDMSITESTLPSLQGTLPKNCIHSVIQTYIPPPLINIFDLSKS